MKKMRLAISVSIFLYIMVVSLTAWAIETKLGPVELSITGFYQVTLESKLGSYQNPNNQPLVDGYPRFLLGRQMLDVNVRAKFSDQFSLTFEPRFIHDFTHNIDGKKQNYDAFPSEFSGNGNLLEARSNCVAAQLWQAYLDYKNGPLWIRVGKQQIAWGEAIALRILDTVNPLDLREFFFFDRGGEEFDRIRIPQWFIRGDYTIPNKLVSDLTLELIFNPGLLDTTMLPSLGAPYNVVPQILKVYDHVPQGNPVGGGRLTGGLGPVQFSLNYLSKPTDSFVGLPRGLVPDPDGLPLLAGFGDPTLYRVKLLGVHPRTNIFGGSMNYMWDWPGIMLRLETTFTPDFPYAKGPDGNDATVVTRRPVLKTMVSAEKSFYVIPSTFLGADSLSVGYQFFETYTGGHLRNAWDSGSALDHWVTVMTWYVTQPILRKRITAEFLAVYDTDGGRWLQPGIHWEMGNHLRFDLFANLFGGKDASARRANRFGSFYWADGVFARFTYGF
jgi:hypothetical protein